MRGHLTRRDFLAEGGRLALGVASVGVTGLWGEAMGQGLLSTSQADVVSIVRIRNGRIDAAVEEAIDLLGGMETVARGKERILLKPNLVSDQSFATTRPEVVETLARLMKKAGKDVSIGEGSSAAGGFNAGPDGVFRVRKASILEPMQKYIFERLGYTDLAKRVGVPLLNLHVGEMVTVKVRGGLAYDEVQLPRSLVDTDLLCSVPMMKTHTLATVTLGMKNLIGLYAGSVYGTVRSAVHNQAADRGSPGIAYEILDIVRAKQTRAGRDRRVAGHGGERAHRGDLGGHRAHHRGDEPARHGHGGSGCDGDRAGGGADLHLRPPDRDAPHESAESRDPGSEAGGGAAPVASPANLHLERDPVLLRREGIVAVGGMTA